MLTQTEEIKSRLNIVDVVGAYVRLHRAGVNFKALCPFHKEKTPSFIVSPARQSWHCFGCNIGGDLFSFVMKMEGFEFPDALALLAKKAGVELGWHDPVMRSERERMLRILEESASFYQSLLSKTPEVLSYLKEKRGIQEESLKSFRLGFAPNEWRQLLEHLLSLGYEARDIERVGLILKKEMKAGDPSTASGQGYYDRFRGRIMFPIFDTNGRIIAFGGRLFETTGSPHGEATPAKYINSPETLLYSKSKTLYGFDRARDAIRKEGSAILVEGYTDVMLSHQAGVKNAVAVSGIGLSEWHLRRLKFLTDTLLLSFDMDEAGFEAARRVVGMALPFGFSIKVLSLPDGKDPADVIRDAPSEWQNIVLDAKHVVQFFLDGLLRTTSASKVETKRIAKDRILPFIQPIESAMEKAHWVGQVASRLGVPESAVWQDLSLLKMPSGVVASPPSEKESPKTRLELLEEYLLSLFLWKPEAISALDQQEIQFSCDGPRTIWGMLQEKKFPVETLMSIFPSLDPNVQSKINHWLLKAEVMGSTKKNVDSEIARAFTELHRLKIQIRMDTLSQGVKEADGKGDASRRDELLREFQEYSKKL